MQLMDKLLPVLQYCQPVGNSVGEISVRRAITGRNGMFKVQTWSLSGSPHCRIKLNQRPLQVSHLLFSSHVILSWDVSCLSPICEGFVLAVSVLGCSRECEFWEEAMSSSSTQYLEKTRLALTYNHVVFL